MCGAFLDIQSDWTIRYLLILLVTISNNYISVAFVLVSTYGPPFSGVPNKKIKVKNKRSNNKELSTKW